LTPEPVELPAQRGQAGGVDAIDAPGADRVVDDKARLLQQLEVLGNRGPADGKVIRKLAYSPRAGGDEFQDCPPRGVGQGAPSIHKWSHITYRKQILTTKSWRLPAYTAASSSGQTRCSRARKHTATGAPAAGDNLYVGRDFVEARLEFGEWDISCTGHVGSNEFTGRAHVEQGHQAVRHALF
jgi:hypothetical protein